MFITLSSPSRQGEGAEPKNHATNMEVEQLKEMKTNLKCESGACRNDKKKAKKN